MSLFWILNFLLKVPMFWKVIPTTFVVKTFGYNNLEGKFESAEFYNMGYCCEFKFSEYPLNFKFFYSINLGKLYSPCFVKEYETDKSLESELMESFPEYPFDKLKLLKLEKSCKEVIEHKISLESPSTSVFRPDLTKINSQSKMHLRNG